jgi:hypothetical protein
LTDQLQIEERLLALVFSQLSQLEGFIRELNQALTLPVNSPDFAPAARYVLRLVHGCLKEHLGDCIEGALKRELYLAPATLGARITRAQYKRLQLAACDGQPLAICFGRTSYLAFVPRADLPRGLQTAFPHDHLLRFATWRRPRERDHTGEWQPRPTISPWLPAWVEPDGDGCGLVYGDSLNLRGQRGSGGSPLYCPDCRGRITYLQRRACSQAKKLLSSST